MPLVYLLPAGCRGFYRGALSQEYRAVRQWVLRTYVNVTYGQQGRRGSAGGMNRATRFQAPATLAIFVGAGSSGGLRELIGNCDLATGAGRYAVTGGCCDAPVGAAAW